MRVGIHAGEPVAVGNDLFGVAVTMASRVCGRCPGGAILVSELARDMARGLPYEYRDFGRIILKGFDEPVGLYLVEEAMDGGASLGAV